jgi:hypothetical protein
MIQVKIISVNGGRSFDNNEGSVINQLDILRWQCREADAGVNYGLMVFGIKLDYVRIWKGLS